MEISRTGGCRCGAVRFEVNGQPKRVGLCHCTDCRKSTGSAFVTFAVWRYDQFKGTGETKTWEGRDFCPTCGSRLFSLRESDNEAEIMLGSFDAAPSDLRPTLEIWTKRREHWLVPMSNASQHIEDPP